jgi:secreted PhoX family phosphatase
MSLSRRKLLLLGGVAASVAALPLIFRARRPRSMALVRDPARVLDLPPGFSYRVLDRAGEPMSDGFRVPNLPDGMGCFTSEPGQLVLLRNHEVTRHIGHGAYGAGQAPPEAYDKTALGGVTRVVLDAKTLEKVSNNLVLTGTLKTCAGGTTPWGWLACEEIMEEGHGYVFLCRTGAARVAPPEKLTCYGRFNHEAIGFDPDTFVAYLTEDRSDGCLYRFVPRSKDAPFEGTLTALAVPGRPGLETALDLSPGQRVPVAWVDVTEPDPKEDTVRLQAQEGGAAVFRRGEGAFFHAGDLYFVTTLGGRKDRGQVFKLHVGRGGKPDELELLAESRDPDVLDCPDNITVAPWGHVYMAEDGTGGNFVRALSPEGGVYDVAFNAAGPGELSGLCFAPDGNTLFVNMFLEGKTLAVQGPFASLGRARPAASG